MQSKSSDLATEWDSTPKMQFSSTPVPSASSNFGIYSEETPSNTAMETSQKNGWSISELWRMQRSAIGEVLEESTNDEGHSATGNSMVSTCSQGFSPPLLETSQYSNVSFSSFLKLFADPENYPADFDHNSTGKNSQEGKYIEPNNLDARLYDLPPCSTSSIVPISIDELSEDIVSSSEHMVSNSQAPEDIHAMITGDSNSLPVMSPPCEMTRCTIDFDFESNFYSALNSQEPNAFEAPKALLPQFRSRKPITYSFGDEEENGICPETLLPQTTSAISAKMQCLDHNSMEEQRRMNLGNTNMSNVYPHKRNSTEALLGENHQPPRKSALLWSSANGYNSLQNSSLVTYDTSSSAPKTATRLPLNTNLRQRTKKGSASDPQSIAARHRRERISERLKILQDMVPNGSKVDLVTMLEKAINYVKFLQLQVQVLATDEYWPKHDMVPTIMKVEDAIQSIASAEANRFKAFSATNMDMSTTWKISAEDPFNSCETSKSKFPC